MSLVRGLFDQRVAVAEADPAGMRCDETELWPEERAAIPAAIAKRRREFIAGRLLARRAMVALGVAPRPVLPGPDRAPIWPADVVGSITHTANHCAVVLAHPRDLRAVGVDVETAAPVEEKLWRKICTNRERAWLRALPRSEHGLAARMIFSAKEAVYKAQYPLTSQFLGFQAVEIRLELAAGRYVAVFRVPSGEAFAVGDALEGTCVRSDSHIAAGVVVPR